MLARGSLRSPLTRLVVFVFVGLALPGSGAEAQIKGRGATVIDTATLELAGQRIRLYGLRGVAASQTCAIQGLIWACGREARWAAKNRLGNHWVDCVERAKDASGEILAVCYLGGVGGPELNAWLVEQGWALAARDGDSHYLAQEESARAAGRGVWRGQ